MKTTEQYIEQANLVHKNKYSYEKTKYCGSKEKICIICPKHGEFFQEANSHLKGCACPECFKERNGEKTRTTHEKFIEKSRKLYGETYDYSKSHFTDLYTKICIICPNHGEFWQTPRMHLRGKGCPECSRSNENTLNDFIEKATKIHGNKYDYSKSDYKNAKAKVCIICHKHGEFWQTPATHLSGSGCPTCGKEKRCGNTNDFIEKATKIHGDKYDYSKVEYINSKTKICIICQKHGEFSMKPNDHLNGQGCPKCGDEEMAKKRRLNKKDILNRFGIIYKDKYSYEEWNGEYKNIEDKIPIICSKHGIFHKTVHQHLQGQGCPKCNSSILENSIRNFLIKNEIEFIEQHKFEWLKYQENGQMRLDFFIPTLNVAIECQGEQHFKPIKHFGGLNSFKEQIERDKLKNELCEQNGIKIIYFSNKKYDSNIITNKKELLKEIKKYE